MHRFLRLIALTLTLSLVLSHEASAQRGRRTRKKPFAAFSESAQRLRDSLTARTSAPSAFARTPVLTAATTFDQSLLRDSVLTIARSQIGARYRLGAETPGKAFDCSGLIRYVMGALSFSLPRTAHEQSKFGREVARDTSQLRPGDLLTFGTSRRITHIGIYAGDGKVIHASTSKRQVIETSLASLGPSLLRKWQSARRLITLADSAGESQ
ncbi:MAG: C40 family peptidase [Gemmatimonadetes bacterium]|jgi:cell wall-associated NlpC family hydrolase|nr:C40 family peptidase [Gemmatimonadota bacterium]MCC7322817.1 C40 family peptidase [Gemmatimonadaceae bacterium]MBK7834690.1 C40 family peptidase [Gemmatimonadota bacterium]MBK8647117.1 C40 family peptidase [Gemmatimonadota bacterium]MBK9408338.1 C40 family peptidase [Gemmatimonadota bacterium]